MVKEFDETIKASLPEGEWQSEPDYQHWVDEETGLDCLIVRHPNSGHLCGYVGVMEGHIFYQVEYSNCSLSTAKPLTEEQVQENLKSFATIGGSQLREDSWFVQYERKKIRCENEYCDHMPESILTAHGGITYSDKGNNRIGHKIDKKIWWFGFDCAHSGDRSLFTKKYLEITKEFASNHENDIYRNIDYVMEECKSLAKQLKEYDNKIKDNNS